MAIKMLEELRKRALEKFDVMGIFTIHRYCIIEVYESTVLIVVGSPPRKDSFEAYMSCIGELKGELKYKK